MNKKCLIELKSETLPFANKILLVQMLTFLVQMNKKCSIELKSKFLPFAHKILLVQMNKQR